MSHFTNSKSSKNPLSSLKGFTLLELLVVIAILGILLSIGFVFYQRALQNARDQTRISDLSNVKIALEQYFSDDNFDYPDSDAGQINDSDCTPMPLVWGTNSFECGGFTYMRVLPGDPTASPQYCYISLSGNSFEIFAQMENSNNANLSSSESCSGSDYNFKLESEK